MNNSFDLTPSVAPLPIARLKVCMVRGGPVWQYTVFVAVCTICGSIKHESVTTITTGYTQRELQRGHAVLI